MLNLKKCITWRNIAIVTAFMAISHIFPSAIAAEEPQAIKAGLATYYSQPKSSLFGSSDTPLPNAPYRTEAMLGKAAPTNQWYSSILFAKKSAPIHAHPMTYQATEQGFELGLASKYVVPTQGNQSSILADSLAGKSSTTSPLGNVEIRYPHIAAMTISSTTFSPDDIRLARTTDWSVDIEMAKQNKHLNTTILHGSPFSYYELSDGDAHFKFAETALKFSQSTDPRVSAFKIAGKNYAIFAPTGAKWEWISQTELVLHLPRPANYFSVAALPDDQASTVAEFLNHAYAFVRDTHVNWKYDEKTSTVHTTYSAVTETKEGHNTVPLLGLYPHQWWNNGMDAQLKYEYTTVRGKIRLLAAKQFTTKLTYHGIVPFWGGLQNAKDSEWLNSVLVGDDAKAPSIFARQYGRGTYWTGKGLGALAQLISIAEQQGNLKIRDHLLKLIKQRLESWFEGKSNQTYFVYDKHLGTLVGYPEEFGNVKDLNDHHFHYGYWIQAAAQVALRDPEWASKNQWGAMVDLMVADIASSERGLATFPYLRNFDLYEGHSWASGNAHFADGNNQESSSEAINAWAGLILWGAATGNTSLRNLGIYLYTTEAESISHYWFDVHSQIFAPEYGKVLASMVFGGKYAFSTWWTEEPRQAYGINLLPITPASIYLGLYPDYIKKTIGTIDAARHAYQLHGSSDGTPRDIWQDILNAYLALSDPEQALAHWDPKGSVELGETRSHTLHWLLSLQEMGTPDFSVTADTPLYSVFKDKNGTKTYLVFNASQTEISVIFNDGKTFRVAPHSLLRSH